jgi:hypothetical protein
MANMAGVEQANMPQVALSTVIHNPGCKYYRRRLPEGSGRICKVLLLNLAPLQIGESRHPVLRGLHRPDSKSVLQHQRQWNLPYLAQLCHQPAKNPTSRFLADRRGRSPKDLTKSILPLQVWPRLWHWGRDYNHPQQLLLAPFISHLTHNLYFSLLSCVAQPTVQWYKLLYSNTNCARCHRPGIQILSQQRVGYKLLGVCASFLPPVWLHLSSSTG